MSGVKTMKANRLAPGGWIYQWKDAVASMGGDKAYVDYYIERYKKEKLSDWTPEELWNYLDIIVEHHDAILLCYEALPEPYKRACYRNDGIIPIDSLVPGKTFCHRHLVSEFLRSSGGYECREYIPSDMELRVLKKNNGDESEEDMFL
jgi:hypothetical protein